MVPSSCRMWFGSVTLSGALLLSSLPGVPIPVKAAEVPPVLEPILQKSLSGFSAQAIRNTLITSAATVPAHHVKPKPMAVQVASEVKKSVITSRISRGGSSSTSAIVKNAQSLLGIPYVFGGASTEGFDCSGFVQYIYKGSGINLPRDTYSQYKVGIAVKKDQLQLGDLVFFTTYAEGASHVGIYIGAGRFIHAGSSGVQTTSLSDSYYSARYIGARRVQ